MKFQKKWKVTEKYNVFVSMGILLVIMLSLQSIFPIYFSGMGATMIIIGLWIMLFYKWEEIETRRVRQ